MIFFSKLIGVLGGIETRYRLVAFSAGLIALILIVFWSGPTQEFIKFNGGCSVDYGSDIQYRSTRCDGGLENSFASNFFISKHSGLQFEHMGSRRFSKVRVESNHGESFDIPLTLRAGQLSNVNFKLPIEYRDKKIRLLVNSAGDGHWVVLGKLKNQSFARVAFSGFIDLFAKVLFFYLVFVVLYASVRLFSTQLSALVLLPLVTGLVGYLSFWCYYVDIWFGRGLTQVCFVGLCFCMYLLVKRAQWTLLVEGGAMLAPLAAYTLLILALALFPFEHGISNDNLAAAIRWRDLPVDNWLPKVFADQIWAGSVNVPMIPGWQSSDRPPLQTGINLLFFPISDSGLSYQVLSSFLQTMVLLPIYVLLRQFKMQPALIWVLLGLMLSGFLAANTLFVWPKLLSAAYLLIVYIALFTKWGDKCSTKSQIFIAALAGALAMLCHGGALFGLLGMYVVLIFRGIKKVFGAGIASGLLMVTIYLPWMLYQKLLDPPGDRLLKWHLAGHPQVTDKPILELLKNAYSSLTFDQWLHNKAMNIYIIFDRATGIQYWVPEIFKFPVHLPYIGFLQEITFANFFFSFWFFSPLIALPLYLVSRLLKKEFDIELLWLGLVSSFGLFIWTVLMFLPRSTSIHQSTFFLWLTVYLFSCVLLHKSWRWFLIAAAILNAALFIQFYVLDYVYQQKNGALEYSYSVFSLLFVLVLSLMWVAKENAVLSRPESNKFRTGSFADTDR
jgi:hypothetical protein